MTTIYDVARLAGVSASTVSRVLSGKTAVSSDTRQRVAEAVALLDFRPNAVARSLALQATRTIAIVLPDITNPYFPALVKGAQDLAEELDYRLILCDTNADPSREVAYLKALRSQRVDGVILVGLVSDRAATVRALGMDLPRVSLDRDADVPGTALVHVDNAGAGRAATEHLLDLGHRRIAFIGGPSGLQVSRERYSGYAAALASRGIAVATELIAEGDFTEEGGRLAAMRLLELTPPPTAVFAANDLMAIGSMSAIREIGLAVPADVSVVGFDDINLARYVVPALTTIRQPTYEMGRHAAELLVEMIGERHVNPPPAFDGELIVRESAAPPKSAGELG